MEQMNVAKDPEVIYPVLYMPKICTTLELECGMRQNVFIDLNISIIDTEGSHMSIYSGYCNVKLIDNYNLNKAETIDFNQVPIIIDETPVDNTFNQSQVWMDPVRSPNVYNHYEDMEALEQYSTNPQTRTSRITVEKHSTHITQNVYNYEESVRYSPVEEYEHKKFKKIHINEPQSTQNLCMDQNNFNTMYGDDEFECGVFLSQLPDDIIHENVNRARGERRFSERLSQNNALKQLMSPDIQSFSKQTKTILFSGHDISHGETIQKIGVNDPTVECSVSQYPGDQQYGAASGPNQKKYQCDKCKRIFQQLYAFKEHMVGGHRRSPRAPTPAQRSPESLMQFYCADCGKTLKTQEKFAEHCAGHGDPELECNKCHKVFASKFTLRAHAKIHTRKYPCTLCYKSFSAKRELRAHLTKGHSLLRCDKCDVFYDKYEDLDAHQATHQEKLEPVDTSETEFAVFLIDDEIPSETFMISADSMQVEEKFGEQFEVQEQIGNQAQFEGQGQFGKQGQFEGQGQFGKQGQFEGQRQFGKQGQFEGQGQFGKQGQFEGQGQFGKQGQFEGQRQFGKQGQFEGQGQFGKQGQFEGQGQFGKQGQFEGQGQFEKQGQFEGQGQFGKQGQFEGQGQFGKQGQFEGQGQFGKQGQFEGQGQFGKQGQFEGQGQFGKQGQFEGQGQFGKQGQFEGQRQFGKQGQFEGQGQFGKQGQFEGQGQFGKQGQFEGNIDDEIPSETFMISADSMQVEEKFGEQFEVQEQIGNQAQFEGQGQFGKQGQFEGQGQFGKQGQFEGQGQFGKQGQFEGQGQFGKQGQFEGNIDDEIPSETFMISADSMQVEEKFGEQFEVQEQIGNQAQFEGQGQFGKQGQFEGQGQFGKQGQFEGQGQFGKQGQFEGNIDDEIPSETFMISADSMQVEEKFGEQFEVQEQIGNQAQFEGQGQFGKQGQFEGQGQFGKQGQFEGQGQFGKQGQFEGQGQFGKQGQFEGQGQFGKQGQFEGQGQFGKQGQFEGQGQFGKQGQFEGQRQFGKQGQFEGQGQFGKQGQFEGQGQFGKQGQFEGQGQFGKQGQFEGQGQFGKQGQFEGQGQFGKQGQFEGQGQFGKQGQFEGQGQFGKQGQFEGQGQFGKQGQFEGQGQFGKQGQFEGQGQFGKQGQFEGQRQFGKQGQFEGQGQFGKQGQFEGQGQFGKQGQFEGQRQFGKQGQFEVQGQFEGQGQFGKQGQFEVQGQGKFGHKVVLQEALLQAKGGDDDARDADYVIAKVMSNDIFKLRKKPKKNRNKKCEVCQKVFDRIGDMKRHLIEHVVRSTLAKTPVSADGTLTIQCEVCQLDSFTKIDKYKAHLREHAKLTLYKCTFCDKSFSDSSNFAKHKKIHGVSYLQCDLCLRKFNSKKRITQHMDYHNQNPPITCDYCGRIYHFKSMLNKHIKTAHTRLAAHRFLCRFCRNCFKSLKEKWDHEWAVHKVRKIVVDCLVCGCKFRKYSELKRHCGNAHDMQIPQARKPLGTKGETPV